MQEPMEETLEEPMAANALTLITEQETEMEIPVQRTLETLAIAEPRMMTMTSLPIYSL